MFFFWRFQVSFGNEIEIRFSLRSKKLTNTIKTDNLQLCFPIHISYENSHREEEKASHMAIQLLCVSGSANTRDSFSG
jgi:hypothetical protein